MLRRLGRHDLHALPLVSCRWKSERQVKKAVIRAKCDIVVDTRLQATADRGGELRDIDLLRCHWLAKACQRNGVSYLYISSARIFSGELDRPYTVDDFPDSEEEIGSMLLRAEQAVRDRCERHFILRLGPVYAERGVNVLTHMLEQLVAGGILRLESRQRGCPLDADDAARAVSAVLDQLSTGVEPWGIYHYCSSDHTSCYEFGEAVLAAASQFSPLVDGAVQLERPADAATVLNRTLDCSRIRNTFAVRQLPWRPRVADYVKRYFDSLRVTE
jgi:dTDP-4-dehydrorhamnose reductase